MRDTYVEIRVRAPTNGPETDRKKEKRPRKVQTTTTTQDVREVALPNTPIYSSDIDFHSSTPYVLLGSDGGGGGGGVWHRYFQ